MFKLIESHFNRKNNLNRAVEISGAIGITLNIVLFIGKIIVGLMSGSIAIISDAINNLSDFLTSIIIVVGNKIAQKPADSHHPFGHGRYEYIVSFVVSIFIFLIGYELFRNSITKIINNDNVIYSNSYFIIICGAILIKVFITLFNRFLSKKYDSLILRGTYEDSRNDILVTFVSLLSLCFDRYFNFSLDGFLGLAISLLIFYTAFKLIRDTTDVLIGKSVVVRDEIKEYILSNQRILELHDLHIHQYGHEVMYGMCDVVVDENEELKSIHEVVDEIEEYLFNEYHIKFSIHIDPGNIIDDQINEFVMEVDTNLKIHDFKMDHQRKIICFDLLSSWSNDDIEDKKEKIIKKIENYYPEYEVKIYLDKDN
ncbi:MAG: cation diffusion facilitator family transporter [Erysipelotrichaceae bacterium]|nr:cation diffusion facilitator family transporter [Erysipelotrichaceae bacterium]